jgi:hypothetical protein
MMRAAFFTRENKFSVSIIYFKGRTKGFGFCYFGCAGERFEVKICTHTILA